MTPPEQKAKELVEKFLPLVGTGIQQGDVKLFKAEIEKLGTQKGRKASRFGVLLKVRKQHEAQQCALIAVKKQMDILTEFAGTSQSKLARKLRSELEQVRKAIETCFDADDWDEEEDEEIEPDGYECMNCGNIQDKHTGFGCDRCAGALRDWYS